MAESAAVGMTICRHRTTLIVVGLGAVLASGCADFAKTTDMHTPTTTTITRSDWDSVRAHTIFFGHQSVGDNMLDGLRRIGETEHWPPLQIEEMDGQTPIAHQALAHAKIGQNGDPMSKVKKFEAALDAGVGRQVDIALMKFCFWDIRHDTDLDATFTTYRNTMADLERRYPNVTFVYVTVPLVSADVDWRARVRRLLGMTTPTDTDNSAREVLNRKIRDEYGTRHILLDIARVEAEPAGPSDPPQLAEEFSSDGAHLNDAGRRRVGAEFIRALSSAASQVTARR